MSGGLVLLTYAIHQRDPVFILGQASGLFIYSRNLWLIYHRPPDPAAEAAGHAAVQAQTPTRRGGGEP